MKEATGDLSMTAVAIVAIAAIAAVFTMLIWPNIRATINRNTLCAQAFDCDVSECGGGGGGMMTCFYIPSDGDQVHGGQPTPVRCPCDRAGD